MTQYIARNRARTVTKHFAVGVATCVALGGMAACSGGGASGSSPAGGRQQTLVVAYQNEVTSLDPVRSSTQQTDQIAAAMYDALIGYNKGAMVPELATSYEYTPDVTAIKITLRSDVTFHSGNKLTSADVVYSLERVKAIGQGIAGLMSSFDSATAEDDTHLTIKLKQPDALFLGALSRIYILDSKLMAQNAGADQGQAWLQTHAAGSGPYTLKSAAAGTFELARFDKFWDFDAKRPAVLTFRRIDNQSTVAAELNAGSVDVGAVANDSAAALERNSKLKVSDSPYAVQIAVAFNTSQGPGAKLPLREAFRSVFDYKGALDSIYLGRGTVANGPMPTNMLCRPSLPSAQQDLDKARSLISRAGLEGATLTMRYQPVFTQHAKAATLLQSNLKSIGVSLKLQPIAFADYLTLLSDKKTIPDIVFFGQSAPYPDIGVMLKSDFWSKSSGTNRGAYANSEVDALIEKAMRTPDAKERCAIYEDVQEIVNQDAVTMPIYTVPYVFGYRTDIAGMDRANPMGGVAYRYLTVAN